MSRIGLQEISIPDKVSVDAKERTVTVKGPNGELSWDHPDCVTVSVDDDAVNVGRTGEDKFARSMHGTARSLIANMVEGVNTGFKKELSIEGVGFRAQVQGNQLVVQAGFSHDLVFDIPDGLSVEVDKDSNMSVTGADKQQVGLFASKVRTSYPAEPYKGKGIRYKDEQIRRKAGKTVA